MSFKNYLVSGVLKESPQLDNDMDFGLSEVEDNRNEAKKYLAKTPVEIYEESDDEILARYGKTDNGQIVYIKYKTDRPEIFYLVEFEKVKLKGVKKMVYQSAVWRHDNNQGGMASKIFFDKIFELHDSICSDSLQTKDGMKFWKARMSEALDKGYHIGLWDSFDEEINWFDSTKESYRDWSERNYAFAWSKTEEKATYRFVISKKLF